MLHKSGGSEAGPSTAITETSETDLIQHNLPSRADTTENSSVISDGTVRQAPRFIHDARPSRYCSFLPPTPRRWANAAIDWTAGPEPPQRQHITPWFPWIQEWPIRVLNRHAPKRRIKLLLLAAFYFIWILTFTLVYKKSLNSGEVAGYGVPSDITCGATYWQYKNNCGMDGASCRPFSGSELAFRCPASCMSLKVLNPRAVGDKEINYQSFVVGGGLDSIRGEDGNITNAEVLLEDGTTATDPVYRGDSFICQAAIHAGVVSNTAGGCGVVKKVGKASSYPASKSNGVQSIEFPSYFPLSYQFLPDITCKATDLRWTLLGVNLAYTIIFSLFVTSAPLFFWTISTALFLHTGLVSDVPGHYSTADLFSDMAAKGLPAAFGAYALYLLAVRRTLTGLTAQYEKTIIWLGLAWVGALTNYTFDFIPIQRLTPHDIKQQPGGLIALIILVIVILFIVVGQIWYLCLEGRLRYYIAVYCCIGLAVIIMVALPDLQLRIHHYIMALIFMPGTSMQTRPSLAYQGVLVGFYVNGLARWGWDSVLQTDRALRGDGTLDFGVPRVNAPIIDLGGKSSITFDLSLSDIAGTTADGFSVLVNDVERYRGFLDDLDAQTLSSLNTSIQEVAPIDPNENNGANTSASKAKEGKRRRSDEAEQSKKESLSFTWKRKSGLAEREFFRFAYMQGSKTWDYTKAGRWEPDGAWVQMTEGAIS